MKVDSRLKWALNKHYSRYHAKIRKYFSKFIKNRPNTSKEDFLWSSFQFLITETSKNSKDIYEMYRHQSMIYFKMARFRMDYEKIKDSRLFQLAHDSNLKSYSNDTSFKMNVEVISGHCCDYCNSLNGKSFDMDYALNNKVLDMEKCTSEFGCNCTTSQVPERDEKGNLVYLEKKPLLNNEKKGCLISIIPIINIFGF